jgi:hypothetical protein
MHIKIVNIPALFLAYFGAGNEKNCIHISFAIILNCTSSNFYG